MQASCVYVCLVLSCWPFAFRSGFSFLYRRKPRACSVFWWCGVGVCAVGGGRTHDSWERRCVGVCATCVCACVCPSCPLTVHSVWGLVCAHMFPRACLLSLCVCIGCGSLTAAAAAGTASWCQHQQQGLLQAGASGGGEVVVGVAAVCWWYYVTHLDLLCGVEGVCVCVCKRVRMCVQRKTGSSGALSRVQGCHRKRSLNRSNTHTHLTPHVYTHSGCHLLRYAPHDSILPHPTNSYMSVKSSRLQRG